MRSERPVTLRRIVRSRSIGIAGHLQRNAQKLLGFESSAEISRLEHGKRTPGLETALVCSTLFGVPVQELFPQLVMKSVDKLRERVGELHQGLTQPSTGYAARKLELLDGALSRSDDELRRGVVRIARTAWSSPSPLYPVASRSSSSPSRTAPLIGA